MLIRLLIATLRSVDQIAEYESTVSFLQAFVDSHLGCKFVFGGDFNLKFNDNV